MNVRLSVILTLITLALSALIAAGPVMAQDPEVYSATPSSAYQGTFDLAVEITGNNFGRGAEVRFLKPGSEVEAEGVLVKNVKVRGSGKLLVTLDIEEGSYVGDTDIEVMMLSGRKGKGTTLFKVESKESSTGNDNHIGRGMICTLNEDDDSDATVMDDGDPVYENKVDQVLCLSGDVVGDNYSPLRFSNLPGGNPKQIKFAKRFLDLAFGDCTPLDVGGLGCTNLPPELTQAGTPDTAYLQVTPYAEQNHIHLMEPRGSTFGMALRIDPRDFDRRFSIQMSNRDPHKNNNILCYSDAEGYRTTDDIKVYVWNDGVYFVGKDDLPDGYTVTTGQVEFPESGGAPPVVSPGYAEALLCSNIGPNGEVCPDRKNRDDLCFALGVVQIQFTLQMEYQQ